jgi:hypothetical protein
MPSLRHSDKWVDLSTRAFYVLRHECEARGWPFTIASVMRFTEADLLRLPNCGRKSVQDIREWLGKRRLALCGERPAVAKPKPALPVPDLVAVLRARLSRAQERAREAEAKANDALVRLQISQHRARRRDRDFEYFRKEAKRKHDGVRREIERLRGGEHHLMPALAVLQQHIEAQLRLLMSGKVTIETFCRHLDENFNEFRFYAGMPTTAHPWVPPPKVAPADYTSAPPNASRH